MKKPQKQKTSYDQITVLCGEPMSCKLTLQDIGLDQYDIIRLGEQSNLDALHSAFNGLSLSDKDNIVVVKDPTTKVIKKIEKYLEKYRFTIPVYIVLMDGYPDLRSSFFNALSKEGKIKEFTYMMKGDTRNLEAYIKERCKENPHVKLKQENLQYIVNNAPTRMAQVKTKSGKYENAVYDLMALENELSKIDIYFLDNKEVNEDWLSSCFTSYGNVDNVWDFVQYAINGDTAKALSMLDNMSNVQSTLFLVLSQLKFLLSMKGANSHNVNDILEYMKENPYIGRYLDDWIEPEEKQPSPANYYRVQKATQEYSDLTIEMVAKKYLATIYAIQDLRQSVHPNVVLTYYTLALGDKLTYSPINPWAI